MTLLCRLSRLLCREPKARHIWKVEREENLGSFLHLGDSIHDICTMYRIAVYERCLVTGETRVRERRDLFPVREEVAP